MAYSNKSVRDSIKYNSENIYKRHVQVPKIYPEKALQFFANKVNLTFTQPSVVEDQLSQNKEYGMTYWSNIRSYVSKTPCGKEQMREDLFEFFKYLRTVKNIAVDGPSSMGKTTLIDHFSNTKVNKYNTCINNNHVYNYNPIASNAYVFLNKLIQEDCTGIVCDRSIIANYTYGMCYYLMNIITYNQCGYRTFSAICDEYVNITNTRPFLEYVNGNEFNVLILLDSNYEKCAKRMNARGHKTNSKSDQTKALVREYWLAQNAAFAYIANMLNFKCIDYEYLRTRYNVTEDELFNGVQEMFIKNYKCNENVYINNNVLANVTPQLTYIDSNVIENALIGTFIHSKR